MRTEVPASGADSSEVSVLAPGMTVQGEIRCDGTIRVNGRVEGSVRAESVMLGEDGRVQGSIVAKNVVIAGAVVGNVVASSRVEMQESCRLEGDVRARRIKIDEGGVVEGHVTCSDTPPDSDGSA